MTGVQIWRASFLSFSSTILLFPCPVDPPFFLKPMCPRDNSSDTLQFRFAAGHLTGCELLRLKPSLVLSSDDFFLRVDRRAFHGSAGMMVLFSVLQVFHSAFPPHGSSPGDF